MKVNWYGKEYVEKITKTKPKSKLIPCKEESKNWDTTENLYIEGDNLEVLKLLQKSYHNKVKMIYIDPPYNTGRDFVYKDNFKDNIKNYMEKTGQVDNEGDKLSANSESNGRYHSNWLNMMYPRLSLARDLLTDDGVIFISIDDNELKNLKIMCDEIFGVDNCIANFSWIKKKKGSHLSKTIRSMTEYVLCYSKNIKNIELFGEKAYSDKQQPLAKRTNAIKELKFPQNTIKTTLQNGFYKANKYGKGTSALDFKLDFSVKDGIVETEIIVEGPFVWTQNKLEKELKNGSIANLSSKFGFNILKGDQGEKIKRPSTLIDNKINVGTNEDAYDEALELFSEENIMSYPKPTSLLCFLIETISYYDNELIVLDFFSGSATTAHAVMQLNAEDGGNRKHIMVQLPEPTDEKSEAFKAGYKNICEIGKERIRRAGEKILEDNKGIENLDIGFKVFKLSN